MIIISLGFDPRRDFLNIVYSSNQKRQLASRAAESQNSQPIEFVGGFLNQSSENEKLANVVFLDNSLIFADANLLGVLITEKNGLKKYQVQSQETISDVAKKFGISVQTILWANPNARQRIKAGQELLILPVSGIIYQTQPNDTLEAIVDRYHLDLELFKKYNPDYQTILAQPNQILILPNAKPLGKNDLNQLALNVLPDLKNYFIMPTTGLNWGKLHENNAVDIANQCDTLIVAAAEGLVTKVVNDELWNNGYGNYLLIEHPNGTETLYAHLSKTLVNVGQYVKQGEKIALMGNTGNTHGPTGCHLHFEIYGAKNPFAFK